MKRGVKLAAGLLLLAGQSLAAADLTAPVPASSPETETGTEQLAWRGEEQWRLVLDDGEMGRLRLGFVQTPAGDYLLNGDLILEDAVMGVTGAGRWHGEQLVLDLSIAGAVFDVPPEPSKQRLYPDGEVPARVSSAGFAIMRAELDGQTLEGRTAQYQTNIVTGHRVQGPVLRLGRLEREDRP